MYFDGDPNSNCDGNANSNAYPITRYHTNTYLDSNGDGDAKSNSRGATAQPLHPYASGNWRRSWHWRLHRYGKRSQTCNRPGHWTFLDRHRSAGRPGDGTARTDGISHHH